LELLVLLHGDDDGGGDDVIIQFQQSYHLVEPLQE